MSNTSPNFITSSIGKKFLMGFTGLFLISFLVIHVLINACIYFNDGGATFNMAASFMAHNIIIRMVGSCNCACNAYGFQDLKYRAVAPSLTY